MNFATVSPSDTEGAIGATRKEFRKARIFYINDYPKEQFFERWNQTIGISPLALSDYLTEGTDDYSAWIGVGFREGNNILDVDLRITCENSHQNAHSKGSYDLEKGISFDEDVANYTDVRGLGKTLMRRYLELGYKLGCPLIRIEATKEGCHYWTDTFDVENVNPNFLERVRGRLELVTQDFPAETLQQVDNAISRGDIVALAQFTEIVPARLSNSHYERTFLGDKRPVSLSRFLMRDDIIKCWTGTADLDNPISRAKLKAKLGAFTIPELARKNDISPNQENDVLMAL